MQEPPAHLEIIWNKLAKIRYFKGLLTVIDRLALEYSAYSGNSGSWLSKINHLS